MRGRVERREGVSATKREGGSAWEPVSVLIRPNNQAPDPFCLNLNTLHTLSLFFYVRSCSSLSLLPFPLVSPAWPSLPPPPAGHGRPSLRQARPPANEATRTPADPPSEREHLLRLLGVSTAQLGGGRSGPSLVRCCFLLLSWTPFSLQAVLLRSTKPRPPPVPPLRKRFRLTSHDAAS